MTSFKEATNSKQTKLFLSHRSILQPWSMAHRIPMLFVSKSFFSLYMSCTCVQLLNDKYNLFITLPKGPTHVLAKQINNKKGMLKLF
jgi:hypothetical protein